MKFEKMSEEISSKMFACETPEELLNRQLNMAWNFLTRNYP